MMIVSCLSMLTLILIPKTKHVFTFRWPTSSRPWWSCRSQPPSTPPTPAGQPLTWTVALAMFVVVMMRSADCWPIMIKTTNTADTILRIVDTVSVASKPLPRKPAFNATMIYHGDSNTIIMIYHDDGNTAYNDGNDDKVTSEPIGGVLAKPFSREREGGNRAGRRTSKSIFKSGLIWNWNNFVTNTRYARAYWA